MTTTHYVYVAVDGIDDVEVELFEDVYGDLHFRDASIGQFVLYTTKEQREMLTELARNTLLDAKQDAADDLEIDIHFARAV